MTLALALGALVTVTAVTGIVLARRKIAIVAVTGPSMEPTLTAGRDLHREWMIKRAAAIPGDPLPAGLPAMPVGDARVPAGKLVVLGDNSKSSVDSRSLGYVPGDRQLGVVTRLLPPRSGRTVGL